MKLGRIAWRNLWRRKRRTFITCFSIGFGVMLAVTFTGAGDYAYTNMINTSATMGMGHVTIEPLGYNQTPSLGKTIHDTDKIREQVLSIPEVKNAIIRITGQAMFASARKSIGGMFVGIDPALEPPDQNLFINSIIQGELFPDTEGRYIIIGYKMAEKLNLGLGKKLVYTTTDVNGEIVSEIARVSGIFKTGVSEVDGAMALLPLNSVRSTLNYGAQDATLVAITIEDHRHSDDVRDKIEKTVGSPVREVLSWKQTQPEVAGLVRIDRSANYISQFLIGILIAAGILNTVLMSVLERTREFGVMMAVGMSPSKLFKLVLVESFWLALIGIVIGIIITTPWYAFMYNVGIDFSGAIGDDYSAGGILVDPVMKLRLYRESITVILTMVFGLTILSGLYPAWRAGRIPPVESLRAM